MGGGFISMFDSQELCRGNSWMDRAVLMWLEANLIEGEDFLLVNNLDY